MRKLYFLKTMLLLCALVVGSGSVWAQSDYSDTYTSNVTLTGGASVTVKINDTDCNGTKLGSSGSGGSCTFSAPTGTKYIHIHVAAWKAKSPSFSYKVGTGTAQSMAITSDNGISGNSPFTFSGDASSSDYYKVITLGTKLSTATTITLTSTSERCVIWGVNTEEESVSVSELDIDTHPQKTYYEVGETLDMTGFVLDADGTTVTSGYTMKIDNVSVTDGVTTLNSAGKKTIEVSYGGKTVNETINVGNVTGIAITTAPTKRTYIDGETFDATGMVVTASLSTSDENPKTWTKPVTGYTISPNGALSVSDSKVTITYANQTAEQVITVTPIAVTGVSIASAITVEKTKTKTLTPTFTPSNASNKSVTWESDNTDVATVSAGVVTAVSVGTANITVTTTDGGFTATCVVTVVAEKGDIDAPFTVEEVKNGDFKNKTGKYVTGYIVGCYNATTPAKSQNATGWGQTNLALADNPGETDGSKTIPVEIPNSGTLRADWGPSNKPYNVDVAKVIIKGNGQTYFSIDGVKGTTAITKVAEHVEISAAGMATYYTDCALDFSEFTDMFAYTAAINGSKVNFTRVNKVPANTAVLLRNPNGASAASHDVPVTDSPESVSSDLTGTLSNIAELATTSGSDTNYILNTGANGVGFYYANNLPVGMHKAYLTVTTGSARTFIGFDNETDGVSATLVNSEERIVNVYDLQGRRVESSIFNSQSSILKKGLYIVNGKKVIK